MSEFYTGTPNFSAEREAMPTRIYFADGPDAYQLVVGDIDGLSDVLYESFGLQLWQEPWHEAEVFRVDCLPADQELVGQFIREKGFWIMLESKRRIHVSPYDEDFEGLSLP